MRFLHTSDWHLGMTFRSGMSYIEDQRHFINEILKIAEDEKVDGIIIAGDVFDKSIASPEALELYDETMNRICLDMNMPVYIIAGNHDGARRLSQNNELLKKSGLFVCGSLKKDTQVIRLEDTDIYMLPWISTDKVKTTFPDEEDKITSLEEAYKLVLDKYRQEFIPGKKNILISHSFIVNATTSVSDKAAEVGRATMIGSYVFDGFDYVALGHIHGPQDINDRIRYCGTPMSYSFGKEENQIKSVTIYDSKTDEKKIIPINNLRNRCTLKGKFEDLYRADFDESILDGYVRIEVEDRFAGLEIIASLKEKYKNLLEVAGKDFEKQDAKITMTIDEFDDAAGNPKGIFERYCEDILEEKPNAHMVKLFENALTEYEKEVVSQ